MPRPVRCRRIAFQPDIVLFKPAGVPAVNLEIETLSVDEIEAIRLKDKEKLGQIESAKKMKVSQPTFNRIITSAREKIAKALTEGKAIKISGGNFKLIKRKLPNH